MKILTVGLFLCGCEGPLVDMISPESCDIIAEKPQVIKEVPVLQTVKQDFMVKINERETGIEACAKEGGHCISVTPTDSYDAHGRFTGYVTFDCRARVLPAPQWAGRKWKITTANLVRAFDAPGAGDNGPIEFYLSEPHYDGAICFRPEKMTEALP